MSVWLFPGQGTQKVGMGQALTEQFPSAARIFERAERALSGSLCKLMFEGPADELTATANAQPAILTASIAALEALREAAPRLPDPAFAAGHSLGEYSALVAAGALEFEDALRIVRLRGEAMQQAVQPGVGAMAAIMGGDAQAVEQLCSDALASLTSAPEGGTAAPVVLSPANFNAPGQVVIAGHTAAVEAARQLAPDRKLKAVALKVSAPFHCSLMAPAAEAVRAALESVEIRSPRFPVVANATGHPNTDPNLVRQLLVRQVDGPVLWTDTMLALADNGQTSALEIGPGKVLAGLAKRCKPSLTVTSLFEPEGIRAWSDSLSAAAPNC